MDQKCTNDTRFQYNEDLDEDLAWLTEKTEDPKSNKGNITFHAPTHTHTHTHTHTQRHSNNSGCSCSSFLITDIGKYM